MYQQEISGKDGMQIVLQIWVLMLLPLLALASDYQTPAITAQDLYTRLGSRDQLLVIDVRDISEYKSGHVPGAINIPHKKLVKQLDRLTNASDVVIYCINGRRTRLAEQVLIENDIPNVFHLEGGLMGWREGGYKVRTGWAP